MQGVRPVAAIGRKAFRLDLCAQAPRVENTQMTAGRLVVLASKVSAAKGRRRASPTVSANAAGGHHAGAP